ncbi:hypothetical protein SDC9_85696 [bioreactor metagenome]|uniref:Uncharacterized protein n=1 Tax=bioreactor metagenome TaxID=1076179 RepID=A0A644ZDV1_9ZZZZ
MDGFHGLFEAQPVLRLADGLGGGTQQLYRVFVQRAVLIKLHGEIQSCLAAQGGQYRVGPLQADDLGHRNGGQRLDIHVVCDILVGHDSGGVGVHQHHLYALFLQGTAGLGTSIVEFGGLADDDRAGT